jgi:hypothetical protein
MMELLNWFKTPLNWWLGLALVINGTWCRRLRICSADWRHVNRRGLAYGGGIWKS